MESRERGTSVSYALKSIAAAVAISLVTACAGSDRSGAPAAQTSVASTIGLPQVSPIPSSTSASTPTSAPTPSAAVPCGSSTDRPPRYDHVLWIWFENHTDQQVIGNRAAPYMNALSLQCLSLIHI